jgi:uncharacterized protein (TIGR03663 family)
VGQAGRLKPPVFSSDLPADRPQAVLDGRNRSPEKQDSASPPRWVRWAAFLLIALLSLVVRLPQLGERPMHTDEAVNAYIIGQLLAGHPFTYDPQDRHGPALAALALPLARMQGAKTFSDLTESELRLTSVLAGSITILLFGAAVEMFGFVPSLIAALLFAVAPLPVYYDRYFVHESIFAAATFGLILAGWHACQKHSSGFAALAGACAALMLASKETAVIHFFALAAATLAFWRWNLRGKAPGGLWRTKSVLTAAAAFLLLSVILFTWFGSNWKALSELFHAVPNFLARAGGDAHRESFWYYAKLLTGGWSGGLIFAAACVGLFLTVRKRSSSPYGFLAFYAVLIALVYSLIPYKTPWLALNFWLPIAPFAGLAFESLWRMPAKYPTFRKAIRAVCILVGALAAALIAHDTQQRVFLHPADEANPYAYAHTSEDLLGLPAEIDRLARQDAIAAPSIAVVASDPWPLPWYLRHVVEVGFWQSGQQPGKADFYITSTEAADQYTDLLKDFRPQFFGVRPGVLVVLWSPAPR